MLHSFTVANYRSIVEPCHLSFAAPKAMEGLETAAREQSGSLWLRRLVLVGPNGSGKTNLLQALAFGLWFMRESSNEHDARSAFSPCGGMEETPTLEIVFQGTPALEIYRDRKSVV